MNVALTLVGIVVPSLLLVAALRRWIVPVPWRAALAFLVVTLLGMAAERRGTHRSYQANTEKRRVLSFLVLAAAILRRHSLDLFSLDDLLGSLALIPTKVSA